MTNEPLTEPSDMVPTMSSPLPQFVEQHAVILRHIFNYSVSESDRQIVGDLDISSLALSARTPFFVDLEGLRASLIDPTMTTSFLVGLMGSSVSAEDVVPLADEYLRPLYIELDGVKIASSAWEFCAKNRIIDNLRHGIDLTRKHFASCLGIRVYVEHDPEDLDEYAVIEVSLEQTSDTQLSSYSAYLDEWSDAVEWPASRMILLDIKESPADSRP